MKYINKKTFYMHIRKIRHQKRVIPKIKKTFHNYIIVYQEVTIKEVIKWKFILSLGYIRTSKSVKAMTFFWMKMLENPKEI